MTDITPYFKVGDRVRTVRYYGTTLAELATVTELRYRADGSFQDYIVRYDDPGNHNGAFQTVGRSESKLWNA